MNQIFLGECISWQSSENWSLVSIQLLRNPFPLGNTAFHSPLVRGRSAHFSRSRARKIHPLVFPRIDELSTRALSRAENAMMEILTDSRIPENWRRGRHVLDESFRRRRSFVSKIFRESARLWCRRWKSLKRLNRCVLGNSSECGTPKATISVMYCHFLSSSIHTIFL